VNQFTTQPTNQMSMKR